MAGLDPAIFRGTLLEYYPLKRAGTEGRVKPGHDDGDGWNG
jgi:hypothetical protein